MTKDITQKVKYNSAFFMTLKSIDFRNFKAKNIKVKNWSSLLNTLKSFKIFPKNLNRSFLMAPDSLEV